MKIIYQTATGIAVVTPTGELSVEETARKDVPAGAAYRIVTDDVDPGTVEFTAPDGVGADYGVGSQWDVIGYTEDSQPAVRHAVSREEKIVTP